MGSYPYIPRINILGIGVSAVNMDQALDRIAAHIVQHQPTYVVVCPVYTIVLSQRDPMLRTAVNRAGLVTPDGMPLVFLSRRMGYPHVRRVYGPELVVAVSEMAAARGYSCFFYGGAPGVADDLARVMAWRFPALKIVGTYSPPFRASPVEEDEAVIQAINEAGPDIIWVGLGSPKQELWMARHRERLTAPVLVGVGAAFDFLTGRVPQAPRWMQRIALEWLFRLLTEPRRLWRRYLIGNPLFLYYLFLQLTGLRRWRLDE
jgi:N-acetylglucosaminyldiphosphoundecaprenol N-acetyl-beta-D-mannosaminyltransferase